MKKIFSALKIVTFIAFIGLAAAVSLSAFSVGGMRSYVVMSGSMEPTIHIGSLIFDFPSDTYAVGDVVTRTTDTPDVTVTHRIVERTDADGRPVRYRTKGDANGVADGDYVPASSLTGKVRFVLPWFGYAVGFAKTPIGFAFLILVPAVIIIYEELRKIKVEIARMWRRRREDGLMADIRISDDGPVGDGMDEVESLLRERERRRRRIV